MTGVIATLPKFQFSNALGLPMSGGTLTSYLAGTTTPATTYQDEALSAANTNPIALDSRGECMLWLDSTKTYKFVLKNALGVVQWTVDNITNSTAFAQAVGVQLRADLAAPAGAMMMGYKPASASASPAMTVQDKLRETVSVLDYRNLVTGDDWTAAITQAIADTLGKCLVFPAQEYRVTSITFPIGQHVYVMHGASFIGIATTPTDCIVKIESEGSTFYDLNVFAFWNTNYKACVWWYNATASSQFNTFFGMRINYAIAGVKGLVYGALPGNTSTLFAQSENQVYGFRTRGCQNPFYGNHGNGFLFFSEPIFAAHAEEAPASPAFDWTFANAFENQAGYVIVSGGEIQKAGSPLGYSASLSNCKFTDTIFETRGPILLTGKSVWLTGVAATMTGDSYPNFVVGNWVAGTKFIFNNCAFARAAGTGTYDSQPFIRNDAAEYGNVIEFTNCDIREWIYLAQNSFPVYNNTEYTQTAGAKSQALTTTKSSELLLPWLDQFCYTTTGWVLDVAYGGGTTLAVTAEGVPFSHLNLQLTLTATGEAYALTYDATTVDALSKTTIRVKPGDSYAVSLLTFLPSGGNGKLMVNFFTPSGGLISSTTLADSASGMTTSWKKVMGTFTAPAGAAYAGVFVYGNSTIILFADLKIYKF